MEFCLQILPYCITLDALTWWQFTKDLPVNLEPRLDQPLGYGGVRDLHIHVLCGELSLVVPKTLNNDFHLCGGFVGAPACTYLVTWTTQLAQKGKLEFGM